MDDCGKYKCEICGTHKPSGKALTTHYSHVHPNGMTVGDLKYAIQFLPDDIPVLFRNSHCCPFVARPYIRTEVAAWFQDEHQSDIRTPAIELVNGKEGALLIHNAEG